MPGQARLDAAGTLHPVPMRASRTTGLGQQIAVATANDAKGSGVLGPLQSSGRIAPVAESADGQWKTTQSFGGNDMLVVVKVAEGEHSRIFELQQTEGEAKQAAGNRGPGGELSPPRRRGSTQAGCLRQPVNPSVSPRKTGLPFEAITPPR